MDNMVSVHFFGVFTISSRNGSLNEQTIHSKKLQNLLAYILLNNSRMISGEELGEFLWERGGSTNPAGALKNLVYRLRNTLKELGNEEYILSRSGAYGWNPNIRLRIDITAFDRLAQEARQAKEEDKIAAYEKALSLYRVPQPSRFTSESWMAVRYTYYSSLYKTLVREVCVLYDKAQQYTKMQKLCNYVLRFDKVDEEIYYWIVKSGIGLEDMDYAMQQYNMAMKILYEQLGVYKSDKLGVLYGEIRRMKNTKPASLEVIMDDICEENPTDVFHCEYAVFREVYRLVARLNERLGIQEYMVLFSIELRGIDGDSEQAVYYKKKAINGLQKILIRFLRKGDVLTRYSDTQFLVLLSGCNGESAERVAMRIMDNFRKSMKSEKIYIRHEKREVAMSDRDFREAKGS